jgi:RNA polymerase sigma-70 factor (ECF subfamily)
MARFFRQVAGDLGSPAPSSKSSSDELLHLARAAGNGNPDAAATLVTHLGAPILSVVRRVMGRESAEVDDVAQDAVVALLGGLATFRGECTVTRFAQRIALLNALTARRRMHVRARVWVPAGQSVEDMTDEGLASPLSSAMARRRCEIVRRLLDELPDVISETLALHFILGYTVDEIAATASVSPNTVWSRLRLGKRALRRKLESDERIAAILEVRE